ncbi:MAG: TetR/AcrR family transcriptional regulator [Actinomycetota bacterium]|nr:TetR/AcrR family transcriptional regulator [Actinomycetota bacterium]
MTRTGGDERRRQLLTEAIRLFGAGGFDGTSLDQIADASGVRKQTLLYYFPTKESLFQACVDTVGSRLATEFERALEGEFAEPWNRVEAVIGVMFRLAEEWPEFPMFVREASWQDARTVSKFAGLLEPLRMRALEFLERGMNDGVFRRQDPALLLFTLYTAVVGSLTEAGVLRAVAGGPTGLDALKRREKELLEFVRSALVPRP